MYVFTDFKIYTFCIRLLLTLLLQIMFKDCDISVENVGRVSWLSSRLSKLGIPTYKITNLEKLLIDEQEFYTEEAFAQDEEITRDYLQRIGITSRGVVNQFLALHKELRAQFGYTLTSATNSPIPAYVHDDITPVFAKSQAKYFCNSHPITLSIPLFTSIVHNKVAASARLFLRGHFEITDWRGDLQREYCIIKHCDTTYSLLGSSSPEVVAMHREYEIYQELQKLAKTTSTKSTGCVHCFSAHPGFQYLVLEDFGQDLRGLLKADLRSPQLVLEGIIPAVQALHSHNIMHGDIKPDNILYQFDPSGNCKVKLCDLDCAYYCGVNCPADYLGTQHYTSPEVCLAATQGRTVVASLDKDIFSLGLVLWQVLQRSATPALHCVDPAELEHLYTDQAALDVYLSYAAPYQAILSRVTSLNPTLRPDVSQLWKHIKALSASNIHQNWLNAQTENKFLKHSIVHKLTSLVEKLDTVLQVLEDQFSAFNKSTIELAHSLCSEFLLDNKHGSLLVDMVRATQSAIQHLEPACSRISTCEVQSDVILSNLTAMRTSILTSIEQKLNASESRMTGGVTQLQETVQKLTGNFSKHFKEMESTLTQQFQEQSKLQSSQQEQAMRETSAQVIASVHELHRGLHTLQEEISILKTGQVQLGAHIRTVLHNDLALAEMLQTVLTGRHDIPTYCVMVPIVAKSWNVLNLMRLVRNQYRLFFLCAHTHQIAPCGDKGKGYKIKVPKKWVKAAAPLLQVGLVLLKLGLMAGGIPLPIPDLCSQLKTLEQQAQFLDAAFDLLQNPPGDSIMEEHVMSQKLGELPDIQSKDVRHAEGVEQAYAAIKKTLEDQGVNITLTCGLRKVTDRSGRTGKTAWVLDNDATEQSWRVTQ